MEARRHLSLRPWGRWILLLWLFMHLPLYSAQQVVCWGNQASGRCTPPDDLPPVVQVATNYAATCALTTAGSVECWGHIHYAKVHLKPAMPPVASLVAGYSHWCTATRADTNRTVYCWGWCDAACQVPNDLPPVIEVAAGRYFSCARSELGAVICWGDTRASHDTGGSDVPSGLAASVQITAGALHACSLSAAGEIICWGSGSPGFESKGWNYGQGRPPSAVQGSTVAMSRTGWYHMCAVTQTGSVKCWGQGAQNPTTPLVDVVQLAVWHQACARERSGELVCWNSNNGGKADVPQPLPGIALDIATGGEHTCAVIDPTTRTSTTSTSTSSLTRSTSTLTSTSSSSSSTSISSTSSSTSTQSTTTTSTSSSSTSSTWTSTTTSSTSWTSSSSSSSTTSSSSRTSTTISSSSTSTGTSTGTSETRTTSSSSVTLSSTTSSSSSSSSSSTGTSSSSTSTSVTATTTSTSATSTTLTITSSTSSSSSMSSTSTTTETKTSTSSSSLTSSSTTTSSSSSTSETITLSSTSSSSVSHTSTSSSSTSATSTTSSSSSGTSTSTSSTATSSTSTSRTVSSSSTTDSTTSTTQTATTATETSSATTVTATTNTATTTTTSPPGTAEERAVALVATAEKEVLGALAQLAAKEESSVTASFDGGTVVSTTLDERFSEALRAVEEAQEAAGNNTALEVEVPEYVRVEMPEIEVVVATPVKALARLIDSIPEAKETGTVLSVTLFNTSNPNVQGLGSQPPAREGGEVVEVASAATIDLYLLTGERLNVTNLSRPIEFTLPTKYALRMHCAFWDETAEAWSRDGVSVSRKSVLGYPIICETLHLSLFAALVQGFVEAILCSQLSLLSSAGMRNLAKDDWKWTPAAMVMWCIFACLVMAVIGGVYMDLSYRDRSWSEEFFLVPIHSGYARSAGNVAQQRASCGAFTGLWAAIMTCFKETAFKDAIDEIASEWFEQFGEVRDLVTGICRGLELRALGRRGLMTKMSQTAMAKLVIQSSRRLAAASLGVSEEVVTFVLKDEALRTVLMARHQRRVELERREQERLELQERLDFGWGSARSAWASSSSLGTQSNSGSEEAVVVDWRVCSDKEEAWYALHCEIAEQFRKNISDHMSMSLCRMAWQIFSRHNPLCEIVTVNIFMSCKLRAFFFVLEITGVLMIACIFFEASGSVASEEEEDPACSGEGPEEFAIAYEFSRVMAVAAGSVLLAGIPVSILKSLHTRGFRKFELEGNSEWKRQLLAWQMQDFIIVALGTMYLVFAVFFICLFLASIDDDGQMEWTFTAMLSFVQQVVLIPLSMAVFMPGLAGLFLAVNCRMANQERIMLLRQVHLSVHDGTNVMLPITCV